MTRSPDWPEKLAQFVHEHMAMPFAWGSNDCALFAADWVLLCTGFDPAEDWRGTYDTAREAVERVQSHGGLAAITDEYLPRHDNMLMAKRGDIALVSNAGRELLAVVIGSEVAAPGATGIVLLPMSDVMIAWRV